MAYATSGALFHRSHAHSMKSDFLLVYELLAVMHTASASGKVALEYSHRESPYSFVAGAPVKNPISMGLKFNGACEIF